MQVAKRNIIGYVDLGMLSQYLSPWNMAVVKAAYLWARFPDHAGAIGILEAASLRALVDRGDLVHPHMIMHTSQILIGDGDDVDLAAMTAAFAFRVCVKSALVSHVHLPKKKNAGEACVLDVAISLSKPGCSDPVSGQAWVVLALTKLGREQESPLLVQPA